MVDLVSMFLEGFGDVGDSLGTQQRDDCVAECGEASWIHCLLEFGWRPRQMPRLERSAVCSRYADAPDSTMAVETHWLVNAEHS